MLEFFNRKFYRLKKKKGVRGGHEEKKDYKHKIVDKYKEAMIDYSTYITLFFLRLLSKIKIQEVLT